MVDLSRRDFMLVGTSSVLALPGGVGRQIDGDPGTDHQFQGVADLMGPAAARPEPGDDFFDDKIAFWYRYEATDTGERSFYVDGDTSWTTISMPIDQYSTPYDALKTAQQFTQFALDPSKGHTRRRYTWFSNNALFDDTLIAENDANGTIDLSTGAGTAQTARIHSAIAGEYLSQSLAQPGVGLDIADANVTIDSAGRASLSHGSVAAGLGWHDKSAGGWGVGGPVQTFLGIRYTANGAEAVLIANGQHIGGSPVPQREWNLDVMDGSESDDNPSGEQLDPAAGYVYQLPYTWYAHGSLYVGVADTASDSVLLFHEFNVPSASFARPNMPPLVIVDDEGTASDLTARLGGMQYALYGSELGEEGTEARGIEITKTGFSITTQSVDNNGSVDPVAEPGDPIISFRRESGTRDVALRLESMFAELDNPIWVFMWDEYDPAGALTGANFRNPNESVHPDTETLLRVDTEATDYAPSVATSRGIDYIYTDKNQSSLESLDTDDRIPIDATRVITAAHEGTEASVDPAQVRVVEGY